LPTRFFNRVQVLPLQIFDQRQLHSLLVVGFHDNYGYLVQACQTGSPPAAFACNDLVIPIGHFPNGQGLNNAMLPDGLCQCLQLLIVKIPAGLVGIGFDFMKRQCFQTAGAFRFFRQVTQQRTKAPAEALL